jgi:hypothetical protein
MNYPGYAFLSPFGHRWTDIDLEIGLKTADYLKASNFILGKL